MSMLVYRLRWPLRYDEEPAGFQWYDSPRAVWDQRRKLLANLGWKTTLKLALQTLSGSRIAYAVIRDGRLLARGRVALGFCRHYPVEGDSAVLGEIWSDPEHRGAGLATAALRAAIDRLGERGLGTFYIDTQPGNDAMRRVISRLGFSDLPVTG